MGRNKTIDDDELLRVARETFQDLGLSATTREIAAAAGISQATLYQRFRSKEDLFLRAMTLDLPDVDRLLGPLSPTMPAMGQLLDIAHRLGKFFATTLPTLLHLLAHPGFGPERMKAWHERLPFAPLVHGLRDRLLRMHEEGLISVPDANAAAHTLLAAVHSIAFFDVVVGTPAHRGASIDAMVRVLWTGIAPSEDARRFPARVPPRP